MKDLRYIIKRILISVGVVLTLSFLKGNFLLVANAKDITPVWAPFSSSVSVVSNLDDGITFRSGGGNWANWGYGILRFNFSVTKVSGTPTAPTLSINSVATNSYTCNVSSTSIGNSTFTSSTFSAECPMNMGSSGLTDLFIGLTPNQQNEQANYRIVLGGLFTFEKINDISLDTSSTTNAINDQTNYNNLNRNQNTAIITNNQNQNTQNIINSQNQNTEKEIESNIVCDTKSINKNSIVETGKFLTETGALTDQWASGYGITDYIEISSDFYKYTTYGNSPSLCFYNEDKVLISCIRNDSLPLGNVSIPTGTKYIRASINISENKPTYSYKICRNGNQAIYDSQNQINSTLNDDNVSSDTGQSFFDDFQANNHGLSGILTAPLRLINSLSSSSCSPLSIPLPFVSQNVSLPCMSTIYSTHFSTFLSLYQLITTGVIGYWVLIKIFGHVKGMQSPNDDRIEVFDL